MRKVNCFLVTTALICSAGTSFALEVTANNEIRALNSGLEQRVETTRSTLLAAFNGLKGTIDDIVARLTALETKMTDVKTKQPVAWNTPLENRLKSIETVNATQTSNISTLNTSVGNHNTRITTLEKKPGGGTIKIGPSCTKLLVGSTNGTTMMNCPTGYVAAGLAQRGLTTGSKVWSGYLNCCQISLQ